jgi:hypothetical protein
MLHELVVGHALDHHVLPAIRAAEELVHHRRPAGELARALGPMHSVRSTQGLPLT